LASNLLRPTHFDLDGRGTTLGTDALQKHACRFVVRVLRYEFAPECLAEDGSVDMIDQLTAARRFGGEAG